MNEKMILSASAGPFFKQIKVFVVNKIANKAWAPGDRILSENELVKKFNVSRMTANRAIKELVSEGYLIRKNGLGTFVSQRPGHASLIELKNIADEISEQGGLYSNKIISRRNIIASKEIKQQMGLDGNQKIQQIRVLHFKDEVPIQFEDRLVNLHLVPSFKEQLFDDMTPSQFLINTIRPEQMEHTVSALLPPTDIAELLQMSAQEPLLKLTRRTWHSGHLVTLVDLYYPSSRYVLSAKYDTINYQINKQSIGESL